MHIIHLLYELMNKKSNKTDNMIENGKSIHHKNNSLLYYFVSIITKLICGLSNGTRFVKSCKTFFEVHFFYEHFFLTSQEYL